MLRVLLLSVNLLWAAPPSSPQPAASIAAVPPAAAPGMPAADRRQLAAASDGSLSLDEGALYPLLRYLMSRSVKREAAEAGAVVPDYAAMLHHPEKYRGRKFLLEGRFPGRPQSMTLSRAGPWGKALTQWGLEVDRASATPPAGGVVLVYLVDPGHNIARPRTGQHLRLTARFFKLWAGRDMKNRPTRYLTFLARPAPGVVARGAGAGAPGGASGGVGKSGALAAAAAALIVGLGAWWLLRSTTKAGPTAAQQRRSQRREHERRAIEAREAAEAAAPSDPESEPLPEDPAEAMAELERRRQSE